MTTPQTQDGLFKFYDKDDNYLGVIKGAISDWRIIQEINVAGSQLRVTFQTEPLSLYEASYFTHYYKVELYVATKTNPDGVLKFIGYISSYDQEYDDQTTTLLLKSYSDFLDTTVFEDAGATTVSYTDTDLSDIIKDALDYHVTQGGKITYDASSIPDSGVIVSYSFNTATVLEVIDKCLEIAGDEYYYYIDLGTNYLHFKQHSYSTVDHNLKFGNSIISLRSDKALQDAANAIYFTGGDTGAGENLFLKYSNANNKTLQAGLPIAKNIHDDRVTNSATAAAVANAKLAIGAEIAIADEIVIASDFYSDNGYPIDTMQLGETVYVGNQSSKGIPKYDVAKFDVDKWDYDIADIGTQLESIRYIEYAPDQVKIIRGRLRENPFGLQRENGRDIKKLYTKDNPTSPS